MRMRWHRFIRTRCIHLAHPFSPDTVLRALAVKHAAPHVPLIVQVDTPRYHAFLHALDAEVLCAHELTAGLLARSVDCPGVSAFVTGLLGSSRQAKAPRGTARTHWLAEFEHGDEHELYHSFMAGAYRGWRFGALVMYLMRTHGLLLVGVETRGPPRVLALHPGAQYELLGDEVVFALAQDKHAVNRALYVLAPARVCLPLLTPCVTARMVKWTRRACCCRTGTRGPRRSGRTHAAGWISCPKRRSASAPR